MASRISDDEQEVDLAVASTPVTGAPTFLDRMIGRVEYAGFATKNGISKPFYLALKIMIGCWAVLVLYFLWMKFN